MSQNANSVRATHHRQMRLIPATTPNQFDAGQSPLLCDDLGGPFTVKPVTGRKAHTPQGANGAAYVARHRSYVEVSGLSIDPDYLAIKKWLEAIYTRISKTSVTKLTNGDTDRYVYRKKGYGSTPVQPYTVEYGRPEDAERATGFYLGSFDIGSGRKNEPSASAAGFARKPTKGVQMSGATPRSAILQILANNVTTSGIFAYKVGNAAPVNVTHAVGDSEGTTVGKLAAAGITATVEGTVETGDGEQHIMVCNNVTTNATPYPDCTITPGMSAAEAQAVVRELDGDFADVTVTSSLTATPLDSSDAAIGATSSVAGITGPGATGANLSPTSTTTLDLGAKKTLTSYKIQPKYEGAGPYSWVFQTSNDNSTWTTRDTQATQGGSTWYPEGESSGQSSPGIVRSFALSAPVAARYIRWVWNGASNTGGGHANGDDSVLYLLRVQVIATNFSYSGSYTFQFPSEAGNVTNIASVPGTGYSGSTITSGANGGAIGITVTSPANTPISVSFVSGAGWSGGIQVAGSNGTVTPLPTSPITASDWAIRRSSTYSGLSAEGTLIDSAYNYSLKVDGIFEPHFTANESETFDRVKCGMMQHTAELSLDDEADGHMAAIEAGSDDAIDRQSAIGWYEFGHRSGDAISALLWRVCMAVNDDIEVDDDEDAEGRKVSLTEISVGTGQDFCVEVILDVPAGTFAD